MSAAKEHSPNIISPYLNHAYNPAVVKKLVGQIVRVLRPVKDTFDVIVFRGMSGALIAPIVASRLNKPLICIRKPDQSHSGMNVEGYMNCNSYIIIDDFVESGATVRVIIDALKIKPVGLVLYYCMSEHSYLLKEKNPDAWGYSIYYSLTQGMKTDQSGNFPKQQENSNDCFTNQDRRPECSSEGSD